MYIIPQDHKCIKCDHEFKYGPHDIHLAPVVDGDPVCPKCWSEFLRANLGIGYCTVAWTKDGSEYEQQKAKRNE